MRGLVGADLYLDTVEVSCSSHDAPTTLPGAVAGVFPHDAAMVVVHPASWGSVVSSLLVYQQPPPNFGWSATPPVAKATSTRPVIHLQTGSPRPPIRDGWQPTASRLSDMAALLLVAILLAGLAAFIAGDVRRWLREGESAGDSAATDKNVGPRE